jgi:hypothetical protein
MGKWGSGEWGEKKANMRKADIVLRIKFRNVLNFETVLQLTVFRTLYKQNLVSKGI